MVARRRLERIRAKQSQTCTDSLLEFIPTVSPHLEAPRHLAPYTRLLERAVREPIRIVVAAPPQHGKTEAAKHALAKWLLEFPEKRYGYLTFGQERADTVSKSTKTIATNAGVIVRGGQRHWYVGERGEVLWTSLNGPFTGSPIDGVLIVDDPVKDRVTAESAIWRERSMEWWDDVAYPRVHPGASVIVMATRWHPADLSGELIARGWEYLNLPAIAEEADDPLGRQPGEALWPERRPVEFLKEHQSNAYTWASLYQGRPRPRGGSVFRDVHHYDELPKQYRVGIGIDLAYTAKTHSDYSVAVALYEHEGKFYVVNIKREQTDLPKFCATMRGLKAAYPTSRNWLWYTSTTERGLADQLREESGIPIIGQIAKADKFVRAQPVASAWNAGKVLVPRDAPWVADFVSEVLDFTGEADKHDDQVDALAAAFDSLDIGSGAPPRTFPTQFSPFGGNPFARDGAIKW